jgi:hypothetical protein
MWMPRRMEEVIGGSAAPSWRDFNSRMRESEIASCRCWRSISAAPRPTDNSILKTPNGSDSASTCITDPPPLPLHRFRHADFTREYSIGMVQHSQYEDGSTHISKDSDVRRGHQSEHSRESTGPKRVLAVSTRDLNRILFTAGEPLCAPQPGLGSHNSEARVVPIEPAQPPHPRDTRSTGMRHVQRVSDRVRSGTCP